MAMETPEILKPGDLIRVIAPSSRFDQQRFETGVNWLKEAGFRVAFREDIGSACRYLAGDDARRSEEFVEAFADDDARAVWCARGGFGAQKLFPPLETWTPPSPKWLVGFSDITALHTLIRRRGYMSIHGPNITSLGDWSEDAIQETLSLMSGASWKGWTLKGQGPDTGTVRGRLLGGNLTVLASLVGSLEAPFFKNEILCIEDVGERPYRLDRALEQLIQAGTLDGIGGVILGQFSGCDELRQDEVVLRGRDVVVDRLCDLGVPVLEGAPFGHEHSSRPFVHGALVELRQTESGVFDVLPAHYQAPGVLS